LTQYLQAQPPTVNPDDIRSQSRREVVEKLSEAVPTFEAPVAQNREEADGSVSDESQPGNEADTAAEVRRRTTSNYTGCRGCADDLQTEEPVEELVCREAAVDSSANEERKLMTSSGEREDCVSCCNGGHWVPPPRGIHVLEEVGHKPVEEKKND
jgi:hypothetical protein